ncbi:GCN5-related N-acetyltransferase [Catenulispora acidiphila DSM 44928]|uniref:GCN5-related N-acetyltransferase n=1 Tax=Catenulispora acidiphila (strain DSM 44928 / JCM 14897 / NBRC 102108 / NRRL B-24433 / ID139908) TaxID=479433 RepID=C7PXF9_CATAD|nr:GNAT family protein [Catenulispora acidiphila]ACU71412.1 GCN5-related N-acetyltransferase [Catenulispora acidiphila DSM 44928]
MTAKTPAPITLTGSHIRLEPLSRSHLPDLFAAGGNDDAVWQWQGGPTPRTEQELGAKLDKIVGNASYVAFAVILLSTGKAIGWTTFSDISAVDERLEIGWTWYGSAYWRSAVNTEAKLLLLVHAFEDLGMGRVQWKTDHMNQRSQNAIARLGAQREGVLRRHRMRPDGTFRDSVYFSMLAEEWPAAKQRLTERLARG